MKIKIENTPLYIVPAGEYHIVFSKIAEKTDPDTGQPYLRITWDVLYPNTQYYQYRLAKNYTIEGGSSSELMSDLFNIFGEDLDHLVDGTGRLDTDKLIGETADCFVYTVQNSKYNHPFSVVSRLLPSGTFEFNQKHR